MDYTNKDKNKLVIKGLVLVGFFIALVITLSFIQSIVEERNTLYNETVTDLGSTWGKEQTIAGPVIVVPYVEYYNLQDGDGKQSEKNFRGYNEKYAIFLPKSLTAKMDIGDEIRNRGIYKATVYTADLQMSGEFSSAMFDDYFKSIVRNSKIVPNYSRTFLSFGITDTAALTQVKTFLVDGSEAKNALASGSGIAQVSPFAKGLSLQLPIAADITRAIPFDISMSFRGSNRLTFLPLGEENSVSMDSTWNNPSFEGFAAVSKTINEKGFSANWAVSKLSRNYPQVFSLLRGTNIDDMNLMNLTETSFGVKFYDGITHYRQVIRAVKYGYLFFALSFLVLFIFDITNKKSSVHYIQYGVVGVSLVMFYLLLLSLSEHISFIPAYLLSTAAVVVPISLYIIGFMKDKKYGVAMFGILTGLYMILLSILKMENYALIMGTGLVMITIYILMYITRNLRGDDKSINKEE